MAIRTLVPTNGRPVNIGSVIGNAISNGASSGLTNKTGK